MRACVHAALVWFLVHWCVVFGKLVCGVWYTGVLCVVFGTLVRYVCLALCMCVCVVYTGVLCLACLCLPTPLVCVRVCARVRACVRACVAQALLLWFQSWHLTPVCCSQRAPVHGTARSRTFWAALRV
eukprot:Tamp_36705.p2 GENE.Tamp_36705~~Tamp_36705.p2  ORF type:complete len:128 (-),score=9.69 Tamp_36705:11-394(-)